MAAVTKATPFMAALRKWAYATSGFNKYGLIYDDILYETPEVEEALRRMPQKYIDDRHYRIIRATQASIQKVVLPEELWTKLEDDDNNRQLSKMVELVTKEQKEREEWERNH